MQLSLSLQSNLQNWPRALCRGLLFLWWVAAVILLATPRWLCKVLSAIQKQTRGELVADYAQKTGRDDDEQS